MPTGRGPRRQQGSSPLTRGKPGSSRVSGVGRRLIPAHAGKTRVIICSFLRAAAHPRSRGENHGRLTYLPSKPGSSPLTRGKPTVGTMISAAHRLIPAHAGKTQASPPEPRHAPAHPRSRGENPCAGTKRRPQTGSSPLTRGKRGVNGGAESLVGLIPAHAGKTI